MESLVALIALFALIGESRCRGSTWPFAVLTGVRRFLHGLTATAGLLLLLVVGVATTRAILHPVADAAVALFPEGQPATSRIANMPDLVPTRAPVLATLPPLTPTPRATTASKPPPQVMFPPVSLSFEGEGSPLHIPVPTASPTPPAAPTATPPPVETPTPTPAPARTGCDPAYPDARTCIPPGPPWDQGCAITAERRFTVLPPDPQGLDHDKDGIGCEPIT